MSTVMDLDWIFLFRLSYVIRMLSVSYHFVLCSFVALAVLYVDENGVSGADAYPVAQIDDLIDPLGKVTYISTIDLTRGYRQVPASCWGWPAQNGICNTVLGCTNLRLCPLGYKEPQRPFSISWTELFRGRRSLQECIWMTWLYSIRPGGNLSHIHAVLEKMWGGWSDSQGQEMSVLDGRVCVP